MSDIEKTYYYLRAVLLEKKMNNLISADEYLFYSGNLQVLFRGVVLCK